VTENGGDKCFLQQAREHISVRVARGAVGRMPRNETTELGELL
jgi:hypothetical protein